MSSKPLFTIILLHYNQPQYVKTALDSIFAQSYENIELIFADDCSSYLNLDALKEYCEANKKDNIKNIVWQINEENLGTVKSLNNALDKVNGEYILFFAADDALHNKNTISNFVDAFKDVGDEVYMVSSQCYMMDTRLEKCDCTFVKPFAANKFNSLSAFEQFKWLTTDCFLAIGATAMKNSMFEKFGKFNEEYKFIEDWSYFLHLTRSGGRIHYSNFDGLLHRDGGVSHTNAEDILPDHVIAYRYDLLKIMENEIFPYIKSFDVERARDVLSFYNMHKNNYLITKENKATASLKYLLKCFGFTYWRIKFRDFFDSIDEKKEKLKNVTFRSVVLWFLCVGIARFVDISVLPIVFNVLNNYFFPIFLTICILALAALLLLNIVFKSKRTLKNAIVKMRLKKD